MLSTAWKTLSSMIRSGTVFSGMQPLTLGKDVLLGIQGRMTEGYFCYAKCTESEFSEHLGLQSCLIESSRSFRLIIITLSFYLSGFIPASLRFGFLFPLPLAHRSGVLLGDVNLPRP